jgi:predicted nucleic acid-binding protein
VASIVLDTDVVSHDRAGRLPAGHLQLVTANRHGIAFATAGELWRWSLVKRWGGSRRRGLDLWLDGELILPAGLQVAKTWASITAGAQRRGRPRPLNDSWIAACCIESGLPLLTLNRRDFADFAEHEGLVLLGN